MPERTRSSTTTAQGKVRPRLEPILRRAKTLGYLYTDEVLAVIPDVEEHLPLLEALCIELIDGGIEIRINPVDAPQIQDADAAGPTEQTRPELNDLTEITPDNILSLYLREMARVPLLTNAQETILAKQIELGLRAKEKLEDNSTTLWLAKWPDLYS